MAEELGRRETEIAINRPQLERQREAAIATARPRSPPTRKSSLPSSPKQERKKAETTAKLEADLKAYEATDLRQENGRLGEREVRGDRQSLGGARSPRR